MTGKLPINLHDLLRQRTIEGERVEYKAGWNPKAVLHTICAFANDFHNLGGGYVVLGVEERNGQSAACRPWASMPIRVDAVQKSCCVSGSRPCSLTTIRSRRSTPSRAGPSSCCGRPAAKLVLTRPGSICPRMERSGPIIFIRHSSTVRARGADERELLALAATVPFDDRYHQTASLDDLSLRLIEQFLRGG